MSEFVRLDFLVREPGGTTRRLEGRAHIVTDAHGQALRMVGTAQDVSEAHRAARALQASEARFRSVVATAGEGIVLANLQGEIILWNPGAARIFGYDMTETLGRPLTMLMPDRFRPAHTRGITAAARQGPPTHRKPLELLNTGALGSLSEKANRMLEIAQSNTERLSRMVGDILDLQLLSQGRVAMDRAPCDVAEVVADAFQTVAPVAAQREVGVEAALALPADFSFSADADRLHQNLVTLLVNAIRYTPRGSRVVVSAKRARGELRLTVDDEGPGRPPTERELVFERFYQAAPPCERQAPGTGLAICRAIVQQHRGRIWVEDGPRGGAAFVVALPARA